MKFRWFTSTGSPVEPDVIEVSTRPPVNSSGGELRASFDDLFLDAPRQVFADAGILGHTGNISSASTGGLLIAGTVYLGLVPIYAGSTVTGVISRVATAGFGLTLVKFGLYDKTGTRLAATADVKADFAGSGIKTEPFSSPYLVTATDSYYAAVVATGTTPPTLNSMAHTNTQIVSLNGGTRIFASETGQTDLDATVTLGDGSLCPLLVLY